jgi:hypothetical protein
VNKKADAGAADAPLCTTRQKERRDDFTLGRGVKPMFKLIATMRRGSATGIPAAWARYPTIEAARIGGAELLRDDRVLRAMIVHNHIPPAVVEWVDR